MDSTKGSIDDSSSETVPASDHPKRLHVGDAMAYLASVKSTFKNNPAVYSSFLEIMKGFQTQTLDTPAVIESVSKLFWDNPDLIMGFNTFLPPGYRIQIKTHDTGFNVDVSLPPPVDPMMPVIVLPSGEDRQSDREQYTLTTKPIPLLQMAAKKYETGTPVTTGAKTIGSEHLIKIKELVPTGVDTYKIVDSMQPLKMFSTSVTPLSSPPPPPPPPPPAQYAKSKPVEFNHAINYVNKIKRRFHDKPMVYQEFLAILNSYQNDLNQLTEEEVFSKVAKLFRYHDDLLAEFAIFLPEASSYHSTKRIKCIEPVSSSKAKPPTEVKVSTLKVTLTSSSRKSPHIFEPKSYTGSSHNQNPAKIGHNSATKRVSSADMKRVASPLVKADDSSRSHRTPPKKRKLFSSDTGKEQADNNVPPPSENEILMQKIRKSLQNAEEYDNFLRCLVLYNNRIVSRSELLDLVTPFLKHPDLLLGLKRMLGKTDDSDEVGSSPRQNDSNEDDCGGKTDESFVPIDFSQCERLGTSYRALPKNYMQPKCSSRTSLCNEVLNDDWICFPVWPESNVASPPRRSETEEHIFCIEDQRFELDMVVETNLTFLKALETLMKNMSRMSIEQRHKLKLDDTLGGASPTHNFTAIRRLYGDKAPLVMEGLKLQPLVCLPLVVKRLKAKDKEWRDAQKKFNKCWRKQDEDFYMKVVDHPPANCNDYVPKEPEPHNAGAQDDEISAEVLDDEMGAEVLDDEISDEETEDIKTEQNI